MSPSQAKKLAICADKDITNVASSEMYWITVVIS